MSGYCKGCGGQVCYCGEEPAKMKKPASKFITGYVSPSKEWGCLETGEREVFLSAEFIRDLKIQYGVHINEKVIMTD